MMGSVDNTAKSQGRLEVAYNGYFASVCSDLFNHTDAGVACRQMGRGSVGYAVSPSAYGRAEGDTDIWMDDVECRGTEARLDACRFRGWGVHDCPKTPSSSRKDIGIQCGACEARFSARPALPPGLLAPLSPCLFAKAGRQMHHHQYL